MAKPPRKGEEDFLGFDELNQELGKRLGPLSNPFEMLYNEAVKSLTRVAIYSSTSAVDPVDVFRMKDVEYLQDMAGAFGLTFDIKAFRKDPAGYLGKFAKTVGQNIIEPDDLMDQTRRQAAGIALSTVDTAHPVAKHLATIAKGALGKSNQPIIGSANPFSLDKTGIKDETGRDVYTKLKTGYLDFLSNKNSALYRDSSYDGAVIAAATAVVADLAQTNVTGTQPDDQKYQAFVASLGTPQEQAYARALRAKTTLAAQITAANKDFADATKALDKYLITNDPTKLTAAQKIFKLTAPQSSTQPTPKIIEKIDEQLAALSAAERAKYETILKPFRRKFKELQELGAKSGLNDPALATKPAAVQMAIAIRARRDIGAIASGGLSKRKLSAGSADSFSRSVLSQMAEDIGLTLSADPYNIVASKTKKGAVAKALLPRLRAERSYLEVEELMRAVESGSVFSSYVWPRFTNVLGAYAPHFWAGKAQQALHGFGLSVTADLINDQRGIGFKPLLFFGPTIHLSGTSGYLPRIGRLDKILHPLRNAALHTFKITVTTNNYKIGREVKGFFRRTAKVVGIPIVAGEHFKLVGTYGQLLDSKELSGTLFSRILQLPASVLTHTDPTIFLNELTALGLSAELAERLKFSGANIIAFREWLLANRGHLGLGIDDWKQAELLEGLMAKLYQRSLDANLMDITKKYVGPLERLVQKANVIQTKFFHFLSKIPGVNALLFKWPAMLLNKLESLLLRRLEMLLLALFGSLTGGIGAILYKILVPLINIFLYKANELLRVLTTTFIFNPLKAILTGDISKMFESWEDIVDKTAKAYMIGCLVIFTLYLMIINFFTTAILDSFPSASPVGGGPNVGGRYSGEGGPGTVSCGLDQISPTSCVFKNKANVSIIRGSYTAAYENEQAGGHGSNDYWAAMKEAYTNPAPDCAYQLPTNYIKSVPPWGPNGPGSEGNVCNQMFADTPDKLSPIYGYSTDFRVRKLEEAGDEGACGTLFLPYLKHPDKDLAVSYWEVADEGTFGTGCAVSAVGYSDVGQPLFKIVFGHIGCNTSFGSGTKAPGDAVADYLYNWAYNQIDNTHVHVELAKSRSNLTWEVLRPEEYLCQ